MLVFGETQCFDRFVARPVRVLIVSLLGRFRLASVDLTVLRKEGRNANTGKLKSCRHFAGCNLTASIVLFACCKDLDAIAAKLVAIAFCGLSPLTYII